MYSIHRHLIFSKQYISYANGLRVLNGVLRDRCYAIVSRWREGLSIKREERGSESSLLFRRLAEMQIFLRQVTLRFLLVADASLRPTFCAYPERMAGTQMSCDDLGG